MFAGGKGLVLPKDPTGLPDGWEQDHGHLDPNGSRHHGPDGEGLEYGKPQPGKTGYKDKEHWHKLRLKDGHWQKDKSVGRNGHLVPGETVSWAVIGAGVAYGAWEIGKWGAGIFFAPETAGGSLVLAGSLP